MRCPSCGTENAPDSRFCGGCGARLASESRVAPTHKISDDARYPTYPAGPPSAPVHVPMAMPAPALARAATAPSEPAAAAMPRRVTPLPAPAPQASSVALPHQGRRWGLVLAILAIDLGLAATGAVLLMQGLSRDESRAAPAPVVKTSAVVEPIAPPDPVAPVTPVVVVSKAVVKARPSPAPPAKVATKPPASKGKATPVDPYAGSAGPAIPDDEDHSGAISDAIDAKSSHAEGVFSRCYTQATKSLPPAHALRGRIQIAFTVLTNGRVDHVTTAENQTGSDQLANCLASEIGGWTFSDHPQDPIDITKIFAFGPSSS